MALSDNDERKEYRVSVRLSKGDYERLERMRDLLQTRKGRSVRVTQATVIVEALEMFEKENSRKR